MLRFFANAKVFWQFLAQIKIGTRIDRQSTPKVSFLSTKSQRYKPKSKIFRCAAYDSYKKTEVYW